MAPQEHRNAHGYPLTCCQFHNMSDGCNEGRSCPERGYLPAMHAPIERNEAQETADKPLYTPASLIGPLLVFAGFGALAFLALLALAFR